jgi:hypothetical protein
MLTNRYESSANKRKETNCAWTEAGDNAALIKMDSLVVAMDYVPID